MRQATRPFNEESSVEGDALSSTWCSLPPEFLVVTLDLGADGVGINRQGALRRCRQQGRRHTALNQLLAQFVGIFVKADWSVMLVEDFDRLEWLTTSAVEHLDPRP